MKKAKWLTISLFSLVILLTSVSCQKDSDLSLTTNTAQPPSGFRSEYAVVNGVRLHYMIGGQGEPLVLLHGFGQNWYMWNRILPKLAARYTVIAPDLRGVGESDKPQLGYDKITLANDLRGILQPLGLKQINLVGHDIGLMVAYAYAASYPQEVKKLVLMDAIIPGVEPEWSQITTTAWWFGFQDKPEAADIVKGNERAYLTSFWPPLLYKKDAFTETEANEFVRAYSVEGGMRGSFEWFKAFRKDVPDNKLLFINKLSMPVLAMGGQYFSAGFLPGHVRQVATNVTGLTIPDAGHWLVQEQPEAVLQGLQTFLDTK